MAVSSIPPDSASVGRGDLYAAYGLRVRSDIPLPLPPAPDDAGARTDVRIRHHGTAHAPEPTGQVRMVRTCPVHGDVLKVFRGPEGTWFWLRSVGIYHLTPDLKTVDVYPADREDPRAVGHAVIQPVLVYVMNRRGMPVLHASGIETGRGAVAFLGMSGQGKSTMIASFLRRGAALLTDDALPLRIEAGVAYGVPGPPHMKLWDATAEHALHLDGNLPALSALAEKKYLALDQRYEYAPAAAPMRAIYVLQRYDPIASHRTDVRVQRLGSRESLAALLSHALLRDCLLPVEEGAFLPLFAHTIRQAPVRALTYPSGFEYQDAIHEAILEDLDRP